MLRVSVYDLDILDINDLVERYDAFIRMNEVLIPETEEVVEYLEERGIKYDRITFGD